MSFARHIFIGDVHGCLHELHQLMKQLMPRPGDRVIFLGDLINRGPESLGVLEYVAGRNYECILGNHEINFLRKEQPGMAFPSGNTMKASLYHWLRNRPHYIEEKNFIAVHAGLQPNKQRLCDMEPEIISNIRTWDQQGLDLNHPCNPPWYELYHGKRPVIYGHWAKQGLHIRPNTIGLDSGCVYGGFLSAYVLETGAIFQVKAAQAYYPP